VHFAPREDVLADVLLLRMELELCLEKTLFMEDWSVVVPPPCDGSLVV
jgi:hypothetical protein